MRLYIPLKRRLLYILISSLSFTVAYYIGSITPLDQDNAEMIREEFGKIIENIDIFAIFFNNIRIALGMFIPGIGIAIGLFAAYMTGTVFNAFAITSPALAEIPSLLILLTPFGILEIFSYGLAISQSFLLIRAIIGKRLDRSIIYSTLVQICIVGSILFVAAVIEYYMIKELAPQFI